MTQLLLQGLSCGLITMTLEAAVVTAAVLSIFIFYFLNSIISKSNLNYFRLNPVSPAVWGRLPALSLSLSLSYDTGAIICGNLVVESCISARCLWGSKLVWIHFPLWPFLQICNVELELAGYINTFEFHSFSICHSLI